MKEILCRIESPYFVAGIAFDRKTRLAIKAAPIIKWMIGNPYRYIENYCLRKDWNFEKVESEKNE